jgi:hypothetical protein
VPDQRLRDLPRGRSCDGHRHVPDLQLHAPNALIGTPRA